MFVYCGKLSWLKWPRPSINNEFLVVVLPEGHVRADDAIYTYTQWTEDAEGGRKTKWFQRHTVEKVTRCQAGDDEIHFSYGQYFFQIKTHQGYRFIDVTMGEKDKYPGGHRVLSIPRAYFTEGEVCTEVPRIWIGRLNWPKYATDEPFMVIVPEGFGADKPVLALWQWTVDQNDQTKVNCIRTGSQQNNATAEDAVKFSSVSDGYTLTYTWNVKTEKLAVHMEGPDKYGQDIEPLDLAAPIGLHAVSASDIMTTLSVIDQKMMWRIPRPRVTPNSVLKGGYYGLGIAGQVQDIYNNWGNNWPRQPPSGPSPWYR